MALKRYVITMEEPDSGRVRRYSFRCGLPLISEHSDLLVAFTLSLRRVIVGLAIVIGFPILFAVGARWSIQAELQAALNAERTAEMENNGYRAVTKQLATQISSLQETVSEIDRSAKIEPATAKAIAHLPALMKNRAVGGADAVPGSAILSAAVGPPEEMFGTLQRLLSALESRLAVVKSNVDSRAELAAATPTGWPTLGWLSATFGEREDPFTGGRSFHTGLDISADRDAPVVAPADGHVVSASYQPQYGNLLVIDHGYGMMTRYGHLSRFAVKPGSQVHKGDLIAYVGSTGRATGPHLHYEILVDGRFIDPFKLLLEPRQP
jgi:murein DD-endopeptidase MepM/ murein hydrolase activator NlpD